MTKALDHRQTRLVNTALPRTPGRRQAKGPQCRPSPDARTNSLGHRSLPLDGKRAEVHGHGCWAWASQLEYACAPCHEPAMLPHFSDAREGCRTTAG